jgi:hypothetical protein
VSRHFKFIAPLALIILCSFSRSLVAAPAPEHDQFRVAIYIPVFVVQKMKDPAYLQKSWDDLSSQVKIDKVYIETYRSGTIADDANLDQVKAFVLPTTCRRPVALPTLDEAIPPAPMHQMMPVASSSQCATPTPNSATM